MRAALCHNDALDRCTAARARCALSLVDAHVVVVLARLSPQVAILVKRGPAMRNAQCQDLDDALV